MVWWIIGGAVAGAAILLIVLNLLPPEKQLERKLAHRYGATNPQFRREMSFLLGPTIVPGNRVTHFSNGDEIFPAMLEAIRGAERSITFETYIYWSGAIGREFAEALTERAATGVRVHVLMDWLGSVKIDDALLDMMKTAGVEVERYRPLSWYHLARVNNRTHRKVLVIDGKVAFTGGVGIADQWNGNAQDPAHWRDEHFRLEGPGVAQAQAVFMDNWIKVTGTVLQGDQYFPEVKALGEVDAQMFSSSPSGGSDSMLLMYLMALAAAEHTIDLSAAYFVPDELTRRALISALKRGVVVRIVVPGKHIDADTVRMASRAKWGELLAAGTRIYEYEPTMYHCKVMIIDALLVSVGSTNFDNRSFRLNDEASLNLFDRDFALTMTHVFEVDVRRSARVTYEAWKKRPLLHKLRELVAEPWASQL
jgi:cardiolipin synthase A/B